MDSKGDLIFFLDTFPVDELSEPLVVNITTSQKVRDQLCNTELWIMLFYMMLGFGCWSEIPKSFGKTKQQEPTHASYHRFIFDFQIHACIKTLYITTIIYGQNYSMHWHIVSSHVANLTMLTSFMTVTTQPQTVNQTVKWPQQISSRPQMNHKQQTWIEMFCIGFSLLVGHFSAFWIYQLCCIGYSINIFSICLNY